MKWEKVILSDYSILDIHDMNLVVLFFMNAIDDTISYIDYLNLVENNLLNEI